MLIELHVSNKPERKFRSVNKRGTAGYSPGWQRHHLLPRQLLQSKCLKPFLNELVHEGLGFEDFRTNGLLLPGTEKLALKQGLPLHRGPHRLYNEMVLERVGAIEMAWSEAKNGRTNLSGIPDKTRRARANAEAMERLGLLQRALRRRLVSSSGKPMVLNRKDPIGANIDFSHLDAMAEMLWQDTSG